MQYRCRTLVWKNWNQQLTSKIKILVRKHHSWKVLGQVLQNWSKLAWAPKKQVLAISINYTKICFWLTSKTKLKKYKTSWKHAKLIRIQFHWIYQNWRRKTSRCKPLWRDTGIRFKNLLKRKKMRLYRKDNRINLVPVLTHKRNLCWISQLLDRRYNHNPSASAAPLEMPSKYSNLKSWTKSLLKWKRMMILSICYCWQWTSSKTWFKCKV